MDYNGNQPAGVQNGQVLARAESPQKTAGSREVLDTSPEAVERVARTLDLMAGGYRIAGSDATADELWRACALLRALAGERGWIATSERLPERNQEVLFYKGGELVQGYYNGRQWYCWHRYDDSGEVGCAQPVAWQPLPPAPSVKGER